MLLRSLVVLRIDIMHQFSLHFQLLFFVVNRVFFGDVEFWLHRPHVLPSVRVGKRSPVFTLAALGRARLIAVNLPVVEQIVVVVAMSFAFFHLVPNFVLRHWVVLNENFLVWIRGQIFNRCPVCSISFLSGLIVMVNSILILNTFDVSPGKLVTLNKLRPNGSRTGDIQ